MSRDDALWLLSVGACEVEAARAVAPHGAAPVVRVPIAADDLRAALLGLVERLRAGSPAPGAAVDARLRVAVSARWMTLATVLWSDALADAQRRDTYLRRQLEAGGARVDADARLVLDRRGRHGEPCAVAAYPAALLDAIAEAARALGARIECIAPFASAAAAAIPRGRRRARMAVAVVDGDALQMVVLAGGQAQFGPMLDDPDLADGTLAAVQRLWRRRRLVDPRLADLSPLHLVDLRADGAACDAATTTAGEIVDLLAPQDRRAEAGASIAAVRRLRSGVPLDALAAEGAPPWRWLAAAAAWIAAGVVAVHAARSTLAPAAPLPVAAAPQRSAEPPAPSRAELERIRATNAAVRALNFPITEALRDLLPARGSEVLLTALDIELPRSFAESAAAGVRIQAVAPDAGAMAQYLEALDRRQPAASALLLQHRLDDGAASQRLHFTVDWTWRE